MGVSQNPPVDNAKKHTILRVLNFLDEGRGAVSEEITQRVGFDRGECQRGVCQLENAGLVEAVTVSKTGTAKSVWSTSPGFKITPAGRKLAEMEPDVAFAASEAISDPTPRALAVVPCMALVPMRLAAPVFSFRFMMSVWEQHAPAETFTRAPVFTPAPF